MLSSVLHVARLERSSILCVANPVSHWQSSGKSSQNPLFFNLVFSTFISAILICKYL